MTQHQQRTVTPARSRAPARTAVVVLALAGCAVATGLTLFQAGVVDSVWEPFFGTGSRQVLTSPLSEALPVPDAALGAVAYLTEAVLTVLSRPGRPRVQLAACAVAAGLGVFARGLVAAQAFLVGAFCTLCLV